VSGLRDEGAWLASTTAGQEDRLVALDRLERALDRLTPPERTVLWLHHYEELSLAEIGARLRVPAKTVKSRLFTARRSLERALRAEDR
jgi:RNA polymerase sigma-70 factor (ECF subfamily)